MSRCYACIEMRAKKVRDPAGDIRRDRRIFGDVLSQTGIRQHADIGLAPVPALENAGVSDELFLLETFPPSQCGDEDEDTPYPLDLPPLEDCFDDGPATHGVHA